MFNNIQAFNQYKIACNFIPTTACKTLVKSLAIPILDYMNILLNGINKTRMNRLQKLQNTAACLVTRTRKHVYITPILADLHWLPVKIEITIQNTIVFVLRFGLVWYWLHSG